MQPKHFPPPRGPGPAQLNGTGQNELLLISVRSRIAHVPRMKWFWLLVPTTWMAGPRRTREERDGEVALRRNMANEMTSSMQSMQ